MIKESEETGETRMIYAKAGKAELEKEFPGYPEIIVNELSLSVACHIGDGALAVACSRIPEV